MYDSSLVFGSEMKSLFAYGVPKEPALEMVEVYLVLTNIPEPLSFYRQIRKLQAGHYAIVKDGKFEEFKYWDLPEIDEGQMLKNKKQVYEEFSYLFEDAVKIRMRSDVPFGAFLSGGLDSSSIVALMSEISPFQVNTFTIGFPEKAFDESLLAETVAKKFNTNHYLGTVEKDHFHSIVDRCTFHYDEPFGDSSAINVDYVSRFASGKVKMVLTGDGGDEVLSGYTSYQGIKLSNLIRKIPLPIRKAIPGINDWIAPGFKGNSRYKLNKLSSVIRTAGLEFPRRIAEKTAYTDFSNIKRLTMGLGMVIKAEEFLDDYVKKFSCKNDFYKLMYLNFKLDLTNDFLVKVDRMSMANSLETRIPFLDFRLVEFMVNVDKDVKMQGWERKSVLRRTVGKKLPPEILSAPKKGFGIPLREWFKEPIVNNLVSEYLPRVSDLLDEKIINQLVIENRQGKKDHGNFIWTLVMLNQMLP